MSLRSMEALITGYRRLAEEYNGAPFRWQQGPPATIEELADLETELGLELPDDLANMYLVSRSNVLLFEDFYLGIKIGTATPLTMTLAIREVNEWVEKRPLMLQPATDNYIVFGMSDKMYLALEVDGPWPGRVLSFNVLSSLWVPVARTLEHAFQWAIEVTRTHQIFQVPPPDPDSATEGYRAVVEEIRPTIERHGGTPAAVIAPLSVLIQDNPYFGASEESMATITDVLDP